METREYTVLEDKKIELKPIYRKRAFFKDGHDGQFMFTGCRQRYSLPYVMGTQSYAKIFKNKGEQEQFEDLLNKKPGDLSLYDRKNPFWAKFWIEITKEGIALDLNNPVHALQFRIIKTYKDIFAPSWSERFNRPSYKYAIVDKEVVEEEENKFANKFETATDLFQSVKNSKKKMMDILRLLDKKVSDDVSKEFLKKELTKIISQTEKITGLPNIDDFITAASDPLATSKIFVLDAIKAGAIRHDDGDYRESDTNKLLGRSLKAVVDHYDDPVNQEDKILIEERIKRSGE